MRIRCFVLFTATLMAAPVFSQNVPPAAVTPGAAMPVAVPHALSSDQSGLNADSKLPNDAAAFNAVNGANKPAADSPRGRIAMDHQTIDALTRQLETDTANTANRTTLKTDHDGITAAKRQLVLDQKACVALEKSKGTTDETLTTPLCQ